MALEILGLSITILFLSFPIWADIDNTKNFILRLLDKNVRHSYQESKRKYLEQEKSRIKPKPIKKVNKICTQYQPFKLSDKEYIICNFICDGICQFKDTTYFIKNQ